MIQIIIVQTVDLLRVTLEDKSYSVHLKIVMMLLPHIHFYLGKAVLLFRKVL